MNRRTKKRLMWTDLRRRILHFFRFSNVACFFSVITFCLPASTAAMEGHYCTNVDAVSLLMEGKASVDRNDATALLEPLLGTEIEDLPLRCDDYTWSELENGGFIVYGVDVRSLYFVIAVDKQSLEVAEVYVLGK